MTKSPRNFVILQSEKVKKMNYRKAFAEKERLLKLLRQNFFLLVSLFLLAFGVALCVRSDLGSSVISSAPYAFFLGGEEEMVPAWSLGMYTNLLNILLVIGQIIVLRRRYRPVQLLQLAVGVVFGVLIDLSMFLTQVFMTTDLYGRLLLMLAGSSLMAVGVALEIRCSAITMPGEGLPAALSRVNGRSFGDMKILTDISLVGLAAASSLLFFGRWQWNIVGPGTLFAMVYVGWLVKVISRHLHWFDRLLASDQL